MNDRVDTDGPEKDRVSESLYFPLKALRDIPEKKDPQAKKAMVTTTKSRLLIPLVV